MYFFLVTWQVVTCLVVYGDFLPAMPSIVASGRVAVAGSCYKVHGVGFFIELGCEISVQNFPDVWDETVVGHRDSQEPRKSVYY